MNLSYLAKTQGFEFDVSKLTTGRVIWLNGSYVSDLDNVTFFERYAYVSPGSQCFSSFSFTGGDSFTMVAEPYGGQGVGANGGGGRCGNMDDAQIKGVGANPLVGDHDNLEHSYGGLDIRKAAIETVYSLVLGGLLPKGVVDVRGLIYIGHNTARAGKQRVWGGLMVRDQCIRPGHFMRSPNFKPRKEVEREVKNDLARIRTLYHEMDRECGGNQSVFIKWLGGYLRDTANQLAFARVMRVSHGTMTASNIAWDGKWLDLPACSFLSGGVNYRIWSQFYEEHNMALSYAMEVIHNYTKFNRVALNSAPLVSYFYEQFQEYAKYYVGYALGLRLDVVLNLPKENWSCVSETFLRVVHSGKRIEPKRPIYDPEDPVISLTAAFFMAHSGSIAFSAHAKRAGLNESESARFRESSSEVMESYLGRIGLGTGAKKSLFRRSFLTAMKRALLPEMWYLPNVDGQVTRICSQGTPEEIGPYIDKHKEVAEWVFEEDTDKVTLFKDGGQSAVYLVPEEKFVFSDDRGIRYFDTFDELHRHASQHMRINNPVIYDFSKFLDRLKVLMNHAEHKSSGLAVDEGTYV